MKIRRIAREYITLRKSLGIRFETGERLLLNFCDSVGNRDVRHISPRLVLSFLYTDGPVTGYWRAKYFALDGFFQYAIGREYVRRSPLPKRIPKVEKEFEAYIYSTRDFHRLIDAIGMTDHRNCHLTPLTMKTILVLLFHTGLRISEALSLQAKDVDLENDLLLIRESKFFKSRIVPVSRKLSQFLRTYTVDERKKFQNSSDETLPFFCQKNGLRFDRHAVARRFRRMRVSAGIRGHRGSSHRPRIHDIRHTFAVQRLLTWYKKGVDVQHALPYLSTYLGHAKISCTQTYISMIPALLQEANRRFEHYFESGVRDA
jgi:site-specific recombinase XerD